MSVQSRLGGEKMETSAKTLTRKRQIEDTSKKLKELKIPRYRRLQEESEGTWVMWTMVPLMSIRHKEVQVWGQTE